MEQPRARTNAEARCSTSWPAWSSAALRRWRYFPRRASACCRQPGVKVVGQALIGGPFALTDHTGKRVTDQDFRGRNMLVLFGFTFCPDVCPSALQVISAALDKLGPRPIGSCRS